MERDTSWMMIENILQTDKTELRCSDPGEEINEKMPEDCLKPYEYVIVWRCCGAGEVCQLYRVKGIFNQEGYNSISMSHPMNGT